VSLKLIFKAIIEQDRLSQIESDEKERKLIWEKQRKDLSEKERDIKTREELLRVDQVFLHNNDLRIY
jgi:hypothetical protein